MSAIINFLLCLMAIMAVGSIVYKVSKVAGHRLKLLIALLFLVHYAAFYFNWSINSEINKDSLRFFTKALQANTILEFSFTGSQFMSALIYPLVKLGASYFSLSFVFASFSFIGFLKVLEYLMSFSKRFEKDIFLILLFFTPSLHFWTAGLTKEAIIFPLMTVVFFKTLGMKVSNLVLVFSMVLLACIRPYLFIILCFSLLCHYIFAESDKQRLIRKILALAALLVFGFFLLTYFVGVEELTVESFRNRYNEIVVYTQNHGNSTFSLDTTNFLERAGLVLFRPLFFDASTFSQIIVSIENLIFVIVLVIFLTDLVRRKIKLYKNIFLWLCIVSLLIFYSLYMYNLGLASRMRVMFMPYIYFLIFFSYVPYDKMGRSKSIDQQHLMK